MAMKQKVYEWVIFGLIIQFVASRDSIGNVISFCCSFDRWQKDNSIRGIYFSAELFGFGIEFDIRKE